ncbi:MAG: PAS domain S-box protein [Ignavibacteriales bacterium]|nr:PAS domain S-box protein [Ignavibacteriales bacterium]
MILFGTSHQKVILLMNPKGEFLSGYTTEELIGKTILN